MAFVNVKEGVYDIRDVVSFNPHSHPLRLFFYLYRKVQRAVQQKR
jgi:hypothetical protein